MAGREGNPEAVGMAGEKWQRADLRQQEPDSLQIELLALCIDALQLLHVVIPAASPDRSAGSTHDLSMQMWSSKLCWSCDQLR